MQTMQFEYAKETVTVGDHVFIVREISNGENERLQKDFFGDVALSSKKDNLEVQLNKKRVSFPEFAQMQAFAAIEGWTYKGENVPLEIENWRNCPKSVTDKVEKVIERLNPSDSEEFSNGHGDGS